MDDVGDADTWTGNWQVYYDEGEPYYYNEFTGEVRDRLPPDVPLRTVGEWDERPRRNSMGSVISASDIERLAEMGQALTAAEIKKFGTKKDAKLTSAASRRR